MRTFPAKSIITVCAVLALISLCGCDRSAIGKSTSKSGLYFDTVVSVEIYDSSSENTEDVLNGCMEICSHYENLFNKNIETSDIARINSNSGKSVKVDKDTVALLSEALKYCDSSDGLFDITINPVSSLWDFHEQNGDIPDASKIREALLLVDHNNIRIDEANNTVTLKKVGASIDIGAVAKGFIADRIADYLISCSVSSAIINMGGDMRLIGSKPSKEPFRIGINDPFGDGPPLLVLSLSDISVATSGTYERYIMSNGKRYHHILDKNTGYSVQTDIESVTVITKRSVDADCLCTLCILLGYERASEFIEKTPETEAVFILSDGTVIGTPGANDHIL